MVLEVVSIAQTVAATIIQKAIINFLLLILSFIWINAPNENGIKHIKFIANVDGSSAIEQTLFILLLTCAYPCAA